jgi:hypothetical protein
MMTPTQGAEAPDRFARAGTQNYRLGVSPARGESPIGTGAGTTAFDVKSESSRVAWITLSTRADTRADPVESPRIASARATLSPLSM